MKFHEAKNFLRSLVPDVSESNAERLLRAADYNVQRAVNFWFEEAENRHPDDHGRSTSDDKPTEERSQRRAESTSPTSARKSATRTNTRTKPRTKAYAVLDLTKDDDNDANEWDFISLEKSAEDEASSDASEAQKGSPPPLWPKLAGLRSIYGWAIRRGFRNYIRAGEVVEVSVEGNGDTGGSDRRRFRSERVRKGLKSMEIRWRAAESGVEGRLPKEVSWFLPELMRRGHVTIVAKAAESVPRVGHFTKVAVQITFFVSKSMFSEPPRSESVYNFFQFIKHGVEGVSLPTQQLQADEDVDQHHTSDSDNEEPAVVPEEVAEEMAEVVDNVYGGVARRSLPVTEQPPQLVGLTMKTYQRQALHWLYKRETDPESAVIIEVAEDGKVLTGLKNNGKKTGKNEELKCKVVNGEVVVEGDLSSILPELVNPMWRPCFLASLKERAPETVQRIPDDLKLHQPFVFYFNKYTKAVSLVPPPAPQACKGGILADEMGMGKTIELLSLILHDKYHEDGDMLSIPLGESAVTGGAAIETAKTQAVANEESEEAENDEKRTTRPRRGQKRPSYAEAEVEAEDTGEEDMEEDDEYNAAEEGAQDEEGEEHHGAKMFRSSRPSKKLRGGGVSVLTPASKVRGRGLRSARTLIVAPMTMISQWEEEVLQRTHRGLRVLLYYGNNRDDCALQAYDVVITTYGMVASEYKRSNPVPDAESSASASFFGTKDKADKHDSLVRVAKKGLFSVSWRRVILDEAHFIKNVATGTAKGCTALRAERRWAVTGTPIQNSVNDVYSLFRFLRHEPWNEQGLWDRCIAGPFNAGEEVAQERLKMILNPLLLRRTKTMLDDDGKPIVTLPEKHVEIEELDLSYPEREFYQSLLNRASQKFHGFVNTGKANQNYIKILALLMRLRQACDHPFLVLGLARDARQVLIGSSRSEAKAQVQDATGDSGDAMLDNGDENSLEGEDGRFILRLRDTFMDKLEHVHESSRNSEEDPNAACQSLKFVEEAIKALGGQNALKQLECPICLCMPENPIFTQCAHVMCFSCLNDSAKASGQKACPVCRAEYQDGDLIFLDQLKNGDKKQSRAEAQAKQEAVPTKEVPSLSSLREKWVGSAKLDALEKHVKRILSSTEDDKIIVFSQFATMLDLVGVLLQRIEVPFERIDGSLPQQRRADAVRRFRKSLRVLIVSLKTAGVGLNLTMANHVFMLDPWWNPAVEDQAIGRVHRLGQNRPVHIVRFFVKHSVEQKMLAMQERKRKVASTILQAGEESNSKLSIDELAEFFVF